MAAANPLARLAISAVILVVIVCFGFAVYSFSVLEDKADATGQYAPYGGNVVVGTSLPPSATNVGSYKGTFAGDNRYWSVQNGPGGFDIRMNIDGIIFNNANKLGLLHEDNTSNTAVGYRTQIWDYVNQVWRNMDTRPHTSLTDVSMNHEIYNGFFINASGDPIDTPLTNFVSNDNDRRIQLRIVSSYDTTTETINIDRIQMQPIIETQMFAADSSVDAGGTPVNTYWDTFRADANSYTVPSLTTGTVRLDHTMEFKHFRTYAGANAVVVGYRGRTTDSALGIKIRIFNVTTGLWENLNSNNITDTALTTHNLAVGNVDLNDYLVRDPESGAGKIRINFFNNTYVGGTAVNHDIDRITVTIGSVTTPAAVGEVTFGDQVGGTSVLDTRNMDDTSAESAWQMTSASTSDARQYGFDFAGTYNTNYSSAANVNVPVTAPRGAAITGVRWAARFKSGSTNQTLRIGIRDVSTNNSSGTGGWTMPSTAAATSNNSATTYTFTEGVLESNQSDYMFMGRGLINLRLRTTVSTSVAPVTADWDFAFASIRWTEEQEHPSIENKFTPYIGTLVTGSEATIDGVTNTGSARALISTDNRYWVVNNIVAGGGVETTMRFRHVPYNGNNKLVLTREFRVSNASLNPIFEIYDYVNSAWRTIEQYDPTNNNTTDATEIHDIYDGYFASATEDPTSTPLTNFISNTADREVQIRIKATYDLLARQMFTDRVQLATVSDGQVSPADHTSITAGTVTCENTTSCYYTAANVSDNIRFNVPSVAGVGLEDYFTFKDVQVMPPSNALVVQHEGLVTSSSLDVDVRIYNDATSTWQTLNSVPLDNITETTHAFSLASIDPQDYISPSGEVKVGYKHSGAPPVSSVTLRIDMLKLTFGTVATSTSSSEVSFGTPDAGTSYLNTRDIDTSSAAADTWRITTEATAVSPYAFDFAGTYGVNYSAAANLNLWVEAPHGSSYQSNRLIARYRSNEAAHSIQPALRDYFGLTTAATGGFLSVGSVNNSSTYSLTEVLSDSSPEDFFYYPHHTANVNFRTTASTALAAVTEDIDFALMSSRWMPATSDDDGLILNTDKFGYGLQGDTVTYNHRILNNTPIDRTFLVHADSSHDWNITASPDSGTIPAGGIASLDIIVKIASDAVTGTIDVSAIKVSSPELPAQEYFSYDSTAVSYDDFPGGKTGLTGNNTDTCLICHDLHESKSEYAGLREYTTRQLCAKCHNIYLNGPLQTGTGKGNYDPEYPGFSGGMAYNKPCSDCPVGSASNSSIYEVATWEAQTHRGHRMDLASIPGDVTYADGVVTSNKNYIPGGSKQLLRLVSMDALGQSTEPATSIADPLPVESASGPLAGATQGLDCSSCHSVHGDFGSILPVSIFLNGVVVGPPGRNKWLKTRPNYNAMGLPALSSIDIPNYLDKGGKWCIRCHDLRQFGTPYSSSDAIHRCHSNDLCLVCHGSLDGAPLQDFPHTGSEGLITEAPVVLCARCHTVEQAPCP